MIIFVIFELLALNIFTLYAVVIAVIITKSAFIYTYNFNIYTYSHSLKVNKCVCILLKNMRTQGRILPLKQINVSLI